MPSNNRSHTHRSHHNRSRTHRSNRSRIHRTHNRSRTCHTYNRSHNQSCRIQPPQWHGPMVDMLIELRRRRNDNYHRMYSRSRQEFWSDIARRFVCMIFYTFFIKKIQIQIFHLCEFRINNHFNTRFTGQQCSQKWRNLVRDYHVSKK